MNRRLLHTPVPTGSDSDVMIVVLNCRQGSLLALAVLRPPVVATHWAQLCRSLGAIMDLRTDWAVQGKEAESQEAKHDSCLRLHVMWQTVASRLILICHAALAYKRISARPGTAGDGLLGLRKQQQL